MDARSSRGLRLQEILQSKSYSTDWRHQTAADAAARAAVQEVHPDVPGDVLNRLVKLILIHLHATGGIPLRFFTQRERRAGAAPFPTPVESEVYQRLWAACGTYDTEAADVERAIGVRGNAALAAFITVNSWAFGQAAEHLNECLAPHDHAELAHTGADGLHNFLVLEARARGGLHAVAVLAQCAKPERDGAGGLSRLGRHPSMTAQNLYWLLGHRLNSLVVGDAIACCTCKEECIAYIGGVHDRRRDRLLFALCLKFKWMQIVTRKPSEVAVFGAEVSKLFRATDLSRTVPNGATLQGRALASDLSRLINRVYFDRAICLWKMMGTGEGKRLEVAMSTLLGVAPSLRVCALFSALGTSRRLGATTTGGGSSGTGRGPLDALLQRAQRAPQQAQQAQQQAQQTQQQVEVIDLTVSPAGRLTAAQQALAEAPTQEAAPLPLRDVAGGGGHEDNMDPLDEMGLPSNAKQLLGITDIAGYVELADGLDYMVEHEGLLDTAPAGVGPDSMPLWLLPALAKEGQGGEMAFRAASKQAEAARRRLAANQKMAAGILNERKAKKG